MMRFLTIILSLLPAWVMALDIRHPELREGSVLDQYSIDLIKHVAAKSGQELKLISYKAAKAQSRKEIQLQKGEYDIDWFGATADIEQRVSPIRYPILKGLLGNRVFITNKVTYGKLKRDMSMSDVQQFKLIQGTGWGDVPILQGGGFSNLTTTASFENIFKMVDGGRVDLFPRSVIEPYGELASRCSLDSHHQCSDKNLLVDDKLLVVYKLPMFFFVSPKRTDLIDLFNGYFENNYDDFEAFFQSHPLVQDSLKKLEGRTVYNIEKNNSLSAKTNQLPDKYWLN
ncbi:hypothetical protein [Litoribrevibacter albus]|uniref:Transporter substrate-binding domain-containing protein n=1 Tax=Litoribrevibacter albus TaxID=1473156 RepID=A0AA37S9J9_9GAMM|nr:hypothetical protein [Litoribrevibacter albus]GLQ30856.1 hypothetical protein GCM10007876_13350 [Litoribrevibacter albus]